MKVSENVIRNICRFYFFPDKVHTRNKDGIYYARLSRNNIIMVLFARACAVPAAAPSLCFSSPKWF